MNSSTYKMISESNKQNSVFDVYEIQYDVQLASNIIEARLKMNLTQEELAKRMNVVQPAVARAENGNTPPTHKLLKKFARTLGARLIPPKLVFQKEIIEESFLRRNCSVTVTSHSSVSGSVDGVVPDHDKVFQLPYNIQSKFRAISCDRKSLLNV